MKRLFLSWLLFASIMFAAKPELMLLQEWNGQDVSGWLMSEKMDGIRAYWDGQKLISRGGVELSAPAWFTEGFPPFAVDGELWSKRGDFETIISIVKKKEPHDGWKNIAFYAFDVPTENGGLIQRLVKLEYILNSIKLIIFALQNSLHVKIMKSSKAFFRRLKKVEVRALWCVILIPNMLQSAILIA